MATGYFEEKYANPAKKFVVYKEISNGTILTIFDEKTGVPICNSHHQRFVTKEELTEDYKPFEFKLATSDKMNDLVAKYTREVVEQLENYGIGEEMARSFKEFYHSSRSLDIYRDMAKDPEVEFDSFKSAEDDEDFDFEDAENLYPFLHEGLMPILKKMLIEFGGQ